LDNVDLDIYFHMHVK